MNGQCLKHDPYPVYLGVTLDRTLSYREHLSRSAVKLKSRNNLITKLTGTSWGPVSEYCCPVWARSSHTSLIDTQLYNTMHLISGCLQPTQLSWLPVLSKVAPPTIIVKRQLTYASYHRSPSKLACVCWCLWASTSTACISMTSMVRYNVCRHNYTVERGLVVGFCGHPHHCYGPYYLTARFRSPWSYVVCDERFRAGHGPCYAVLHKWGLAQSPSCDCGQRQTMNHIVDTCPLTKFEGGLNLLHKVDDDAFIWLESTVTVALTK